MLVAGLELWKHFTNRIERSFPKSLTTSTYKIHTTLSAQATATGTESDAGSRQAKRDCRTLSQMLWLCGKGMSIPLPKAHTKYVGIDISVVRQPVHSS